MKIETIRKNIAASVRKARAKKGMTREDLAKKTGLTQQTIYNVESGGGMNVDTLIKIKQELNIDELFI